MRRRCTGWTPCATWMPGTKPSMSSRVSVCTSSRAPASGSGSRAGADRVRVTVCELPHEARSLAAAWPALCEHTAEHASQLVLLPELAMAEPVWESERFDAARWSAVETLSDLRLRRLLELRAEYVVGTRPV